LEERGKLLEETKNKWESSDKKYENLRENNVKVEGNKLIVVDPRPPAKEKEKKQVKANEKTKAVEKVTEKTVPAEPVVKSAILARRRNRGASEWDSYVVVGNLKPKMKNLGKPSDMDICNYFLHNHKDVADVKFLNWTENVFVKFQDVAAAEKFLSLSYVMFYGNDLHLNDVEGFLKKKTPVQKDEIAKILLGKKFANISTNVTHPPAANNVANGSMTMEVELSAFSSKQNDLRNMFISELHLSEDDVGQANWVKKDQKFSARLPVKLEEGAISYMVKRWNDLKINVAGETVSAQMTTTTKGVKRENGQAKQGKSGKANKKRKFSFYENY